MTTVSGTFTEDGVSSVLSLGDVPEIVNATLTGTFDGASIHVQRATTPAMAAWETLAILTAAGSFEYNARPNERIRFEARGSDSSTDVDYEVSDGDKILEEVRDPDGVVQLTRKQSGYVFAQTITGNVAGNVTGNVTGELQAVAVAADQLIAAASETAALSAEGPSGIGAAPTKWLLISDGTDEYLVPAFPYTAP